MDKVKLLITAFTLTFFAASIAMVADSVGNLFSTQYARFITPLLAICLLLGIPLFIISRLLTAYLREMSIKELKSLLFTYHKEYFDFIGHDHETVKRFKMLTDNQDIKCLKAEWKLFEKTFRKLEHAAGHSGRPIIMDYYLDYIYAARLLEIKMRKESSV